jgi:hypothetical protein
MRRLRQRTVVFDCETTTDRSQRLLFGVARLYIDNQTAKPATTCVREIVFYADDLPDRDPTAFATLRAQSANAIASVAPGRDPRLWFLSRAEFVEQIIWRWGYRQQATIVGFNLPFDLTRLAVHVAPARRARRDPKVPQPRFDPTRPRGGISLRLWDYEGGDHPYRPRIVIRAIDQHRQHINFTPPKEPVRSFRGRFLDVRTLAFAHSDQAGLSLEGACAEFGVPFTKQEVTHGVITDDYITYCRRDVAATVDLYRAVRVEHDCHPITLAPHLTFSGATIGKHYWRTMGIQHARDQHADFPDEVHGWGMAAFFGGRAECRIRKVPVPVVACDFKSMYMTCNTLMRTWQLITAETIRVEDVTRDVQALLGRDDLAEAAFDPAFWRQLHTLVLVEPNGATLPVRARYEPARATWGIGVNPFHSTQAAWYPVSDLIAARILDPSATPIVQHAVRLIPEGRAEGLAGVKLSGEIPVHPARDDFFAATVERRHRIRRDTSRDSAARDRIERFLKVLASGTGYGILAQFNRHREPDGVAVTVHADRAFTVTTTRPEVPGPHCFPPIAAALTGAARLMLALLEHEVTRREGTYAFCDTDSMAIVATRTGGHVPCPGGTSRRGRETVRALRWDDVDAIVDKFAQLNPYDPDALPGSILDIETENYTDRGRRQQLTCFAISAKRYVLCAGQEIKRASGHGLGHLIAPTGNHRKSNWIEEAWDYLRGALTSEPSWLDQPALSRLTISSPEMLAWFRTLNEGLEYSDQIKPANFLLIAHPNPLASPGVQPVAPYERAPKRVRNDWLDRATGRRVRLRTGTPDGYDRPGTVYVQTYRDVLARYLAHPEAKALGPDGRAVTRETIGLLRRRPVEAIQPLHRIGREANDLSERAHGLAAYDVHEYAPPEDAEWHTLVVPVLRQLPSRQIVERTGIPLRTVQRALAGTTVPVAHHLADLRAVAVEHARGELGARARQETDLQVLYRQANRTV